LRLHYFTSKSAHEAVRIIDACTDAALLQLCLADIKYLSFAAWQRAVKKGLKINA
jgi:hypothetical protein